MDKRLSECLNHEFSKEYILPFFWQHGEGQDILEQEMEAMRNCGIEEFCVESRPHEAFGEDKWWDDFEFILKYAKQNKMKVWLLDDKHFPTGYANGYLKTHPKLNQVTLTAVCRDFLGGTGPMRIQAPQLNDGESFVLVAAYERKDKNGVLLGDHPILLTDALNNGFLSVDLPKGLWRVFYLIRSQSRNQYKNYIDMLNPESTKAMIEAVYEPHYRRFKKYFKNTFKGFFSDEPCFGNWHASYHGNLGNMPTIPWRDDLPELMAKKCALQPAEIIAALPSLFQKMENIMPTMRFSYMDVVTELYSKNFCYMLGDWCRSKDVMYIGHVVEDMGTHLTLSFGAGHFFRALDGQDMAGIDIVLHQITPGILEHTHTAAIFDDMADPKFFNYLLGKLAASHAHIDTKKAGRAMCEIFGAFGWAEGLPTMKKMADLMLCCGINYFVPHAFSPKLNDSDCPPHFYNRGTNPHFELFGTLMGYIQRVSHVLSGGTHRPDVAVLYNTGRWSGLDTMETEEVAKILTQNQIDFEILPEDYILNNCTAEGFRLKCGNETYSAIVVPYCQSMSIALRRKLDELSYNGIPLYFINDEPSFFPDTDLDFEALGPVITTKLKDLPSFLRMMGCVHLSLSKKLPHVRYYHTTREDSDVYMFLNEDECSIADFTFNAERSDVLLYDAYENKLFTPKFKNGDVRIKLEPSCSILVICSPDLPAAEPFDYGEKGKREVICTQFSVSVAPYNKNTYKSYVTTTVPSEILFDDKTIPDKIRYDFSLPSQNKKHTILDLGVVGETAELWINSEYIGAKIAPPYRFDISGKLHQAANQVVVHVVSNQAYRMRDPLSEYLPIPLPGIRGEIRIRSFD